MSLRARVANLEKLVETLGIELQAAQTELEEHNGVLAGLESEVQHERAMRNEAMERLRLVEQGIGPVWKTATGHLVPVKLMSDNHLSNILSRGFGGPGLRRSCEREQERRREDDEWSRRSGKPSPREQLDSIARRVPESGRLLTMEEAVKVFQTLGPFSGGYVGHRSTVTGRVVDKPCAWDIDFGKVEHRCLMNSLIGQLRELRDTLTVRQIKEAQLDETIGFAEKIRDSIS